MLNLYPDQIKIYTQTGQTDPVTGHYSVASETVKYNNRCDAQVLIIDAEQESRVDTIETMQKFRVFLAPVTGVMLNWQETYTAVSQINAGDLARLTLRDSRILNGKITETDATDGTVVMQVLGG